MAKIIYGAGVSQMSGKQGGTVFSRNKSGAYTRTNRKGTNPNTSSQIAARAKFSNASRYWKSLSELQQQSFKDNALNYPQVDRLGQTIYLSGSQLASKYANLQALADMVTAETEMGSPIAMGEILTIGVNSTVVGGVITALAFDGVIVRHPDGSENAQVPIGQVAVIKATKLMGAGFTAPKKKDFRVIGTSVATSSLEVEFNLKDAFENVFGLQLVGGDARFIVSIELVSMTTPQSTSPNIYQKLLV